MKNARLFPMRRVTAVWLCRALLACGAAVGIRIGAPELTWPYFTVSDVLETSGGPVMYASWVAALGVWVASHGSLRDAFTRAGLISLLAPVFPCPNGTPIEIRHVPMAPLAYAAHGALGGAYVAVMLGSLNRKDARRAGVLCAGFLAMYIGGQLLACEWIIAVASMTEWIVLLMPSICHHHQET